MPRAILGAVVMWEHSCPSFHGAGILEEADSKQLVTNGGEKTLVAGERGGHIYTEVAGVRRD